MFPTFRLDALVLLRDYYDSQIHLAGTFSSNYDGFYQLTHTTITKQCTFAPPFHSPTRVSGCISKPGFYHQCWRAGQSHSNRDNPGEIGMVWQSDVSLFILFLQPPVAYVSNAFNILLGEKVVHEHVNVTSKCSRQKGPRMNIVKYMQEL